MPEIVPPDPTQGAIAPAHYRTEIAHATRGRIRLKIPGGKKHPEIMEQMRLAFAGQPGVDNVEVRPDTGSIVILYDPERHPNMASVFTHMSDNANEVARAAAEAAHDVHKPPPTKVDEIADEIEREAEFLAEHSAFARVLVDATKQLDVQIKKLTNNNLDLKVLVPVGLAAVTVLEIGATAATPMWVTLAVFSVNHFIQLHSGDKAGGEPPP